MEFLEANRSFLKINTHLKIDEETALFGRSGFLDSIGLVHLIVHLEKKIKSKSALKISLVSSKAMSATQSPFRTVGTLAEFIEEKMK